MLAFLSHIDEIRGLLGAAKMQSLPTDDRIIAGHISDALAIANTIRREFLASDAPDLLSIAKRWVALDGGAWNIERHAAEKADLLAATRAAIAKVDGPTQPENTEKEGQS